jgi:hypothetical protein
MNPFDEYVAGVGPQREALAGGRARSAVLSPTAERDFLELFLIHFSALGVGMTEPVEDWIERAGKRCEAVGLVELGTALQKHARHEAGHHLMMIEDTRKLVARWNASHPSPLDADALLAMPPTAGVRAYRELHEDVIAGPTPYGQLAIEYEIEYVSVRHGPELIGQCVRKLGPGIVAGLSFVEEHAAVDVGHTKFNESQMRQLLDAHPDFVPAMIASGRGALAAYGAFLDDCVAAAEKLRG